MPFAGTGYLWPDAEGITSNLVLLATSAATELAGHFLSMGDIDGVFWATGQGLKVLPGHEELIALRMRAHARAGDLSGVRQEWESYERVLDADPWSDGEPAPKLRAAAPPAAVVRDAGVDAGATSPTGRHPQRPPCRRDRQRVAAGTRSSGVGGPGGVPSPNGRPPSSSRPCGVRQPARSGPSGHDAGRVDVAVDLVVVALDVHEVDRVAEAGRLEEVAGVGPQDRQLGQLLAVALEVPVVHGVEPGQRREQPDVGLGDRVADEVALVREPLRQPVEAGEEAVDRPARRTPATRRTRSGRRRC